MTKKHLFFFQIFVQYQAHFDFSTNMVNLASSVRASSCEIPRQLEREMSASEDAEL